MSRGGEFIYIVEFGLRLRFAARKGECLWRCRSEMMRSAVALASFGGQVDEIKRLERPSRIRFGASSALLEYAVMHGDPSSLKFWRTRQPAKARMIGTANYRTDLRQTAERNCAKLPNGFAPNYRMVIARCKLF